MKTRLAVGIGALALIIPSVLQRDLATRIDTYLRPFVETNNFSGVIYIDRGEQVLFQRGYGLANPTFDIANPLVDIRNARRIAFVIQRGKVASRGN